MRTRIRGRRSLRELTGSPYQLLLLACSFALAGYAGVRLLAGEAVPVALWFAGSALLHDLVLLPCYAALDRAAVRLLGACGRRTWLPYVRGPALLSGLLLLVWFPLISGRVEERYAGATGLSGDDFLARWLLVTAALFAGSALLLAARSRSERRSRSGSRRRSRARSATKARPPASQ
ncbi:hypothetical protein QIS99_02600 [Streptomyces sp. B-S-A8]|uniref:Lipoprotein n=1 Tax=Streptomyces solicavernae TaxID=3043614 RepID=A0ABT6RL01_9ACTN|nr:hypothetical protein [Streptomyces sp. B-S-A8]MDI3385111.1 hypothetical protein [Streptomyces sp. B-S-A8]